MKPLRDGTRSALIAGAILLTAGGSGGFSLADEAADRVFFEARIRPLLIEHCYECHASGAKKIGGGLLLDSRDGWRTGGDSGPAIAPDKPDDSLLIKAVRYTDDALQMPPRGKLPATAIAALEEWVRRGAFDPRERTAASTVGKSSWDEIARQRADWWSLQAVKEHEPPAVRDQRPRLTWIDHFLAAELEKAGITPATAAAPRSLARRLALVITGLPLTVERGDAFARECEAAGAQPGEPLPPEPVERLVDELLASPHFGERWARHWMDVVRYTETHGNEWNYEVHHAWRYRDYLIRALNADVPYDQLMREHIAGDLLDAPRVDPESGLRQSSIGTAFFRFGEVNHDDCISLRELGYDILDNQIDTLTKAFQATTVACARCHDHKLDAVSMRDYYALLGILRSSRLVAHTLDLPDAHAATLARMDQLQQELRQEVTRAWLEESSSLSGTLQAALAIAQQRPEAPALSVGIDPQRLSRWTAALAEEKQPLDDPLEPLRRWVKALAPQDKPPAPQDKPRNSDPASPTEERAWHAIAAEYRLETQQRQEFNQSHFEPWADFREALPADWDRQGWGPLDERFLANSAGEIALAHEGESVVSGLLPRGCFTHLRSAKFNGTLRSPVLTTQRQRISFQVLGQRSSALRLVSNHCQLNYKNYRALIQPELHWITFELPEDRESLRTYAELMTMLDNPKFPDQLSALGGDSQNYRLPWDKAAENPRSYFGIARVVLHDVGESPRAELGHMQPLIEPQEPASLAALAQRFQSRTRGALSRLVEHQATDDDIRWLAPLLRRGLLSNRVDQSPRIAELCAEWRRLEVAIPSPQVAPGLGEGGTPVEQPLFVRGNCRQIGETVERRFLDVLGPGLSASPFTEPGSGRRELAEAIARSDNPLTARVIVNRIWHHLFGTGLVRTVDDFGHVGEFPSHPELLDTLSARFVADGWSMKRLIREIVLSRTFQSSSEASALARERDPQNRLLQHFPARRLEAEAIRDSILFASGRFDATLFGTSIQPYREKEYADRRLFPGPLDGAGRRSVYIKVNLMESPKFLGAFNLPGGKVAQGRRDVTNVPAQALALLNDPFVFGQAEHWADRLLTRNDQSVAARIEQMFRTALGRPPSTAELSRFERLVEQFAEVVGVSGAALMSHREVWKDLAHAMFNLKEFSYVP